MLKDEIIFLTDKQPAVEAEGPSAGSVDGNSNPNADAGNTGNQRKVNASVDNFEFEVMQTHFTLLYIKYTSS